MRLNLGPIAAVTALLVAVATFLVAAPPASAQDIDQIVRELETNGYYIEPGAEGSDSRFGDLVRQGQSSSDNWYFVSMAESVSEGFADDLFDAVAPRGNVLVYFLDGDFVNVQLASEASESIETRALAPFDGDWDRPEDFMGDVISEYGSLTDGTSGTSSSSSGNSSSGGGGFPWLLVGIPVLLIGGFWFMGRRGKKKKEETDLETAQKIRAELQTEIDELANDVLVLSGPVDVSENEEAINYYRQATDTYLTISDEVPDIEQLDAADLSELAEIGTRVAHARWQMDAAEAVIEGEPIPEKPKVEPPPAPEPPQPRAQQEQRRRQLPQRQPRPRVPYSRSRRRSGGGLLDILIAGAGMMGSSRGGGGMFGQSRGRSGGGMFGGGSRARTQSRSQTQPRSGGGVFGGGSRSSSSNRSSSRRSSSRSSSRRSTSRRSTSKRRIR